MGTVCFLQTHQPTSHSFHPTPTRRNMKGIAAAAIATVIAFALSNRNKLSTEGSDSGNVNVYETDDSLHMYLGLHYPSSGVTKEHNGIQVPPILPHHNSPTHGTHFPQRVAKLLISLNPKRTTNKVLDMGCAVGGSSFELAKSFDHVDAFDYSENFISAAKKMQSGELMEFKVPMEAELFETVRAIHEPGVTPDVTARVNFFVGDACHIDQLSPIRENSSTTYDGIIMSNLLCRLPDPMATLNGLNKIVNPGGIVVLVTPFSWLTEFTPRDKWIGGYLDPITKKQIRSKDALKVIMERNGFTNIHEEEMPLVIREHARKYQYIVSKATAWKKN